MNTTSTRTLASLLPSPTEQVRMLEMLNYGCRWDIEPSVISSLLGAASRWEEGLLARLEPTQAVLLDIGLWSFNETLCKLLGFVTSNGRIELDSPLSAPAQFTQRCRDQFMPMRLAWKTVEFGETSFSGNGEYLPDLAVLWALACSATFLEDINRHFGIHCLWLKGTMLSGKSPYFEFGRASEAKLCLGHPQHSIKGYSVPRFAKNPW